MYKCLTEYANVHPAEQKTSHTNKVLKLKGYEMDESVESVGGGSLGSMATDLSYNLE